MADMVEPDPISRHSLYLSDDVWGETKRRAVIESSEASTLVNRVLETYLVDPSPLDLRQRRSRGDVPFNLNIRTVFVQDWVWKRVQQLSEEWQFSVSVLCEYLLRNYLGLEITKDLKTEK
jgi:hypothetical protein